MTLIVVAVTAMLEAPAGAQLTGTFSKLNGFHIVDLAAEGGIDWAIWGYAGGGTSTSLAPDVRRAGGSEIPSLIDLSTGNPLFSIAQHLLDTLTVFNWNNGSPVPQATGRGGLSHNGNAFPHFGEGFRLLLPAGKAPRRVRLYVLTSEGIGRLTARLSDDSAPAWSRDHDATNMPYRAGVYEIQYAAASNNQTLEIDWVVAPDSPGTFGTVALQAASIQTPTVAGVPVFSPSEGTYSDYQSITIDSSTPGATIRYTLDGSTPGPQSPSIPSGGTVLVSQSETVVHAYAEAPGVANSPPRRGTYILRAGQPTFSPEHGSPPLSVSMTSTTSDAQIYFTTDGSEPSPTHGTLYASPVLMTQDTVLRAIATKPGFRSSPVTRSLYHRNQIFFVDLGDVPVGQQGALITLLNGEYIFFDAYSHPSGFGEAYVIGEVNFAASAVDQYARRHARGDSIDSSRIWCNSQTCYGAYLAVYDSGERYGEWADLGQGYLGFRVYSGVGLLFNYGWVHLSNTSGDVTGFVLHSFALQIEPGVPIVAGDTGCPADFNHDRIADSRDFFDYLAAFFNNDLSADFDRDGAVNSQDFFDFLAAFFLGCD